MKIPLPSTLHTPTKESTTTTTTTTTTSSPIKVGSPPKASPISSKKTITANRNGSNGNIKLKPISVSPTLKSATTTTSTTGGVNTTAGNLNKSPTKKVVSPRKITSISISSNTTSPPLQGNNNSLAVNGSNNSSSNTSPTIHSTQQTNTVTSPSSSPSSQSPTINSVKASINSINSLNNNKNQPQQQQNGNHLKSSTTTNNNNHYHPPPPKSSPSPMNTLTEFKKNEIYQQLTKCPTHKELYKLYCTMCDKLICLECIISHNGHQFNKIPIELSKRMSDIETLVISMNHYPNKLYKQKQLVEQRIIENQNLYKDTKQKISHDIDVMIKNLQERKDQLELQMDKDWTDQKQHLEEMSSKITKTIDRIQTTNQLSQQFINELQIQRKLQQPNGSEKQKQDEETNSLLVSTSLLNKYTDLKELDEVSNQIFNEQIINLEWKWDPEFQFPQIITKTSTTGQPTAVVYRKRTQTVAYPSPSSSATSTPIIHSSTPPIISSQHPPLPIPLSGSSSSVQPSSSSQQSNSMKSLPKITSSASMMHISSVPHLPSSASSTSISSLNNGQNGNHAQPTFVKQNSFLNGSGGTPPLTVSTTAQKLQLFKNPVFGKLLTRKDSIASIRTHYLYTIGGNQMEIFDTNTNKWKFGAPLPKPTTEFSCIYDSINTIYCFGGRETPKQISKFIIDKNQWETLEIQLPRVRMSHCTVFDGKKYVYVLGGTEGSGKLVDRYDLTNQSWTTLKSMTYGRHNFNCFYNGSKYIYAVDGHVTKERKSTIEMYDIEKDSWTVISDIKQPRYFAGVSYDGTKYIHIVGGIDRSTAKDLKTVERFDTQNHQWETNLDNSILLASSTPALSTSTSFLSPPSNLSSSNNNLNSASTSPSCPSPENKSTQQQQNSMSNNRLSSSNPGIPGSGMLTKSMSTCSGLSLSTSNSSVSSFIQQPNQKDNLLSSSLKDFKDNSKKIQIFCSTIFDGEQFIYYLGINIDLSNPILFRYNIRTKKLDKMSTMSSISLFNQLVIVSK
eukprot:gene2767-3441_t